MRISEDFEVHRIEVEVQSFDFDIVFVSLELLNVDNLTNYISNVELFWVGGELIFLEPSEIKDVCDHKLHQF